MDGEFVGFSRIFLLGILMFKGLTARRLYKSFSFKGLKKMVFFFSPAVGLPAYCIVCHHQGTGPPGPCSNNFLFSEFKELLCGWSGGRDMAAISHGH
jgi:hypothetical protein